MVASLVGGPSKPELSRDMELGHRVYKVTWKVRVDPSTDGPAVAILCPGLPQYGDVWRWGTEADDWAWCRWGTEVRVSAAAQPERPEMYDVSFTFSTKPDSKACLESQTQDPLLLPPKISGNFQKFREEATVDRFGAPVMTSSFERLRGPEVEFDNSRPIVKIEMPVANLNLELLYSMREAVNAFPLWGFPPRCIKLSQISWERLFYGVCYVYYKWNLEFEINPETWDKQVLDQSNWVLNGKWDQATGTWKLLPIKGAPGPPAPNPNPRDPSHFMAAIDRPGNPKKILLNGAGVPAGQFSGVGAIATADLNVTNNGVLFVTIINGGAGYFLPPTVSFTGGGGPLGITATPAQGIAAVNAAGQVTGVTVTSPGTYFGVPPTVQFTPATGPAILNIQKYNEADFTLLGIPLDF